MLWLVKVVYNLSEYFLTSNGSYERIWKNPGKLSSVNTEHRDPPHFKVCARACYLLIWSTLSLCAFDFHYITKEKRSNLVPQLFIFSEKIVIWFNQIDHFFTSFNENLQLLGFPIVLLKSWKLVLIIFTITREFYSY